MLDYGIIASHPGVNTREIAELLTLKKTTVENAIKALREKNIILHTGSRTKGECIIIKNNK